MLGTTSSACACACVCVGGVRLHHSFFVLRFPSLPLLIAWHSRATMALGSQRRCYVLVLPLTLARCVDACACAYLSFPPPWRAPVRGRVVAHTRHSVHLACTLYVYPPSLFPPAQYRLLLLFLRVLPAVAVRVRVCIPRPRPSRRPPSPHCTHPPREPRSLAPQVIWPFTYACPFSRFDVALHASSTLLAQIYIYIDIHM